MTPSTDRFSHPLYGEGRDLDDEQDIEAEKAEQQRDKEKDDE